MSYDLETLKKQLDSERIELGEIEAKAETKRENIFLLENAVAALEKIAVIYPVLNTFNNINKLSQQTSLLNNIKVFNNILKTPNPLNSRGRKRGDYEVPAEYNEELQDVDKANYGISKIGIGSKGDVFRFLRDEMKDSKMTPEKEATIGKSLGKLAERGVIYKVDKKGKSDIYSTAKKKEADESQTSN